MLHKLQSYKPDAGVIRNFFIYFMGALCVRAIVFLLAPINMRLLTPQEYGLLSLINNIISVGVLIVGLGLRQFLAVEYFHHDALGQQKLINQLIAAYASVALPICIIALIAQPYITNWFAAHHISSHIYISIIITIFFYFFAELLYQVLKYRQLIWILTIMQIAIAGCSLIITLVLLWYFQLGILSNLIGQFSGLIFATSVGAYLHRKKFAQNSLKKLTQHELRYFLKHGFTFLPGILLSWIIAGSDRFILAKFVGLHEVGIYAVADMFGQLFQFFVLQAWSATYLPYILMQYQQNKENILIIERKNQITMWVTVITLAILMALGYLMIKPLILYVLPPNYHEALNYVYIILSGYLLLLGSYFAASFIQFHKKTYFLAASFCIPAILNVLLNILLVPHYKMYGCTFATLGAYAVYFGIILWYNKKLRTQL